MMGTHQQPSGISMKVKTLKKLTNPSPIWSPVGPSMTAVALLGYLGFHLNAGPVTNSVVAATIFSFAWIAVMVIGSKILKIKDFGNLQDQDDIPLGLYLKVCKHHANKASSAQLSQKLKTEVDAFLKATGIPEAPAIVSGEWILKARQQSRPHAVALWLRRYTLIPVVVSSTVEAQEQNEQCHIQQGWIVNEADDGSGFIVEMRGGDEETFVRGEQRDRWVNADNTKFFQLP